MEKVSIILAAYNGERFIKQSLDSLVLQSYKNIEIIAVDDCSTDKTSEIINSFKEKRIRYFRTEKNSGLQAAPRNLGIKNANGGFIAFCDQDDLWHSEKLAKQIEAYEKSENKSEIGVIATSADVINEKGERVGLRRVPSGFLSQKKSFSTLLLNDYITNCSALVPGKIFDELGLLDETLKGVDDYDLYLRIAQKYSILGIDEILCSWRVGPFAFSHDLTRLFLEAEMIFEKMESDKKSDEIKKGHAENLTKIFLSLLASGKDEEAKGYLQKLGKYKKSQKAKFFSALFNFSPELARRNLIMFRKLKRIYYGQEFF